MPRPDAPPRFIGILVARPDVCAACGMLCRHYADRYCEQCGSRYFDEPLPAAGMLVREYATHRQYELDATSLAAAGYAPVAVKEQRSRPGGKGLAQALWASLVPERPPCVVATFRRGGRDATA